jgi:class 3 adenylate cyclase/tetratricopeptide (TPR) repeat protein
VRCPRCGTELPERAKFCLECGLALSVASGSELRAAGADTPVTETAPAHRAPLEGEHKQVTVLFCDLANSTPLAERLGPEGMHAFLNRFFELALAEVNRYEGTINQFLGDGFMALFGAPIAHEDDARRAVMAALGIRRTLRDRASWMGAGTIAVRIGLNTGPVVIGRIGDHLRTDYTAVGDTTNVAARLQQAADPGDVLIAESTARLVRGDVRLDPLGGLTVKGKSEPVVAYRVRGTAPRRSLLEQGRERTQPIFVGRDGEQRRLTELATALAEGRGHIVSVVGEAGSGKSRLLYEFRRSLEGGPLFFLEGRCRSFGASTPYLPIVELLRNDCDILDTDTPEAIASKVRLVVEDLGMDRATLPYILRLLGVKEGAESVEDMPAETVKARTLNGLEQMLGRGSRRRPLVLLVEDVHWIDAPSEEYITRLARALADAPILLVTTTRPEYAPPWLEPARSAEILLQPLSDVDSRRVVESVVERQPLPERVLSMILDKADGNPLFLEELTRSVAGQHDPGAAPAVPETLQGVLMARIDRLPETPRRLLQTAAVLGREFSLRLLEAVWDGPGRALSHLEELTRLEFVHPGVGEEPAYAFNHALSQEVAYESLLLSHRRTLHEAAGRALERQHAPRLAPVLDRLALHYSRAEQPDKAIEYLALVADRALHAYANAEAIQAVDEALEHADRLPEPARTRARVRLAVEKSQALVLLGALRESVDVLLGERAGVEALQDPMVSGPYNFRLASVFGLLGQTRDAVSLAEQALRAAEDVGDRVTMGRARYLLAREGFWAGRLREGVEHARRGITLLEATGDRWWLSMAHWAMAVNHTLLGDFAAASAAAARAKDVAAQLEDPRLLGQAEWTTGWVHAIRGEWPEAVAAGQRAVELAPEPFSRALARGFLGIVYLEKGDVALARPLLDDCADAFAGFHFRQLEGWMLILGGQARLANGETAAAHERVLRGRSVVESAFFAPAVAVAERVLGEIAHAEGKLDDAVRHLRVSLRFNEEIGARFDLARVHLSLAEVARARDHGPGVTAELEEARRGFEALDLPAWVARTRRRAEALGVTVG